MRFAAIADIHGNAAALDAVLADIAALGISDIVNLGDVASGPLAAAATIDVLMARDLPTVRGNHDRWLVERAPEAMGPWERVCIHELSPRQLAWLKGLPPTLKFKGEVFLCHGTQVSDNTYWLEQVFDGRLGLAPLREIEAAAEGIDAPLMLCGHSHVPRAVRLSDGRLVVNPGSVGCPGYRTNNPAPHIMQTGTPDASYAILQSTPAGWSASFRSVPYDARAMIALAGRHDSADWVNALSRGWLSEDRT